MIQPTDIEKLVRFSKGISDAEENQYVYSLFAGWEDSQELENYLKNEWIKYLDDSKEEDQNLSYLLDRIHYKMQDVVISSRQTTIRKIYRWYSAAAAILLLPILIIGGILLNIKGVQETVLIAEKPVTSTIHAPLGSRISFDLPDGTRGWLNSGSTLEYQMPFSNNRQVAIQGEAFFDVAPDTSNPFEITAGNSRVKVLGTRFNLNAYPDEKYVEVVLDEGKVEFSIPGSSHVAELKPNERLVYNDESFHITTTEPSKFTSWVEGKLMFRGDPMPEVARRIARWYNVDVELVDKDLENDIIRGTFQDDSLEEVLHYITMTSPIRYRIINRKVLEDGTYQKKKVLLYRNNI